MTEPCTVLCVDDEPHILSALTRVLRGSGLRLLTAAGGAEAIGVLETEPVDVLLSDMRMPGMDGAQLLALVSERWPATVRLLLTGHADQRDTVRAINAGKVFAYLSKPWEPGELTTTIARAAESARRVRDQALQDELMRAQNSSLEALAALLETRVEQRTAQLEQANARLKRHYMASIKMFANLIELRGGQLVGHGRRVAHLARQVAVALGADDELAQRVFVAGLLHDIGLIGLPDSALARSVATLDADQQALHARHAAIGEQALGTLEDLQPVAALIRSHHERFDGKGLPDGLAGTAIELGARILAAVDVWDELHGGAAGVPGLPAADARAQLERGRGTQFDPCVLDVLRQVTQQPREQPAAARPALVGWAWLEPGMVLAADLRSRDGVLLLAADQVLTRDQIERVRSVARRESGGMNLQIKPTSMATARPRSAA